MSVCSDAFRQTVVAPRRVRAAECSEFEGLPRWFNLYCAFNLTPDPGDNEPIYGAWTAGDLPVSIAFQDVDTRGDDLGFVAIGNRVYVLDWETYRDQYNWETYLPIYRRLTLGPIPGNRDAQEGAYRLAGLKRFRRLTFQLAEAPTDADSQYRISVQEDGAAADTAATGLRDTQRHGTAQVAKKGYSFLCTLEHQANEDFPLLWWEADLEDLGDRRPNDPIGRE
jgi:hypothetical protein